MKRWEDVKKRRYEDLTKILHIFWLRENEKIHQMFSPLRVWEDLRNVIFRYIRQTFSFSQIWSDESSHLHEYKKIWQTFSFSGRLVGSYHIQKISSDIISSSREKLGRLEYIKMRKCQDLTSLHIFGKIRQIF